MTMITVFRLLGVAGVGAFLAAAFTPLPDLMSRSMTTVARLDGAAAIVVLGGGGVRGDGTLSDTSMRRTLHGIELYRQGLAPLLVLSGPASTGPAEAEVRARLARECGVPAEAILTERAARTTHEEGINIGALLRPKGIRKIIVVADAQGTARAVGVFERVGFEVAPAAVGDVSGVGTAPEERLKLLRRVVIELLARSYYRVAGYL